jgi:1-acyl-sn-glycerol-3-phosphate acyltransferase
MSLTRQARRAARIAGFGAVTGAMLPVFLAHERVTAPRQRAAVREAWVGAWCTALLRMFGVRALVSGPVPARGRGHLVVANHRSTADILLLLRTFGGCMVSRADLARWPLVGVAARSVGTVFVDRSDVVSGANTVRAIRDRLREGDSVIVFPEGTTFPGDEVRPFRAGAFVSALRSGADVVPVGIAYARNSDAAFVNETFLAHLKRMSGAAPSSVAMCVGDRIPVEPGAHAAQLRDRAQEEVTRLVAEARRLVDGTG